MEIIPFNEPYISGQEIHFIKEVIDSGKIHGDGTFTVKCQQLLEQMTGAKKALLTTSCTDALEMASFLIDLKPGDEVITPSYTFVSSSNPFVSRGANIQFADIRPDTMNMDENVIESVITEKTKAIVPVHYAGVGCEMDRIMDIAEKHNLYVIEDAAQALDATYKEVPLGRIGHLGCISFHDTKNIHCGEGGVLLINDQRLIERAEILREKGTNRKKFMRGEIDKYTWVDVGSSFLPSELNAAFLWAQLNDIRKVTRRRGAIWNRYYSRLRPLKEKGIIELPILPTYCNHNGHIFFIKLKDMDERDVMMDYLKSRGIHSVFHYIPLHNSKAGKKYGKMPFDRYTTRESRRLLRLPLYFSLDDGRVDRICDEIHEFFDKKRVCYAESTDKEYKIEAK